MTRCVRGRRVDRLRGRRARGTPSTSRPGSRVATYRPSARANRSRPASPSGRRRRSPRRRRRRREVPRVADARARVVDRLVGVGARVPGDLIVVPPADFAPRARRPSPRRARRRRRWPRAREQPPDLLRTRLVLDAANDDRDLRYGVRRRSVVAPRASASRAPRRRFRDDCDVEPSARRRLARARGERVVRIGQRQHLRDPLKRRSHAGRARRAGRRAATAAARTPA